MSNFESTVSTKNTLVKFYQEWCGHCKNMKPTYDQLSKEYYNNAGVVIADVNCGSEPELCEAYGVTGYPTIKYWVKGEENDYGGGRDYDSLKTFAQETLEVKCDINNSASTCSERALKYIAKMSMKLDSAIAKEIHRLNGMKDDSMKVELKHWVNERLRILRMLKGEEL
ncbi:hypothetical protein TrLO_g6565 [Triparma laevis f. longispina]|uniref:Thioredoxin domain-containing protein n=1 Tax=Triparma laevis f. longispina TaxID=1714387 RepID=A0A9W7KS45_9STRA|nr:hypothetical protein TrLO_g6565 [Triparma laevis f. longispina]